MAGELLPDGYTCPRLGGAIRQGDGSVMIKAKPAPVKKSPLSHGLARRHLALLDTQAADPDASLQSGVALRSDRPKQPRMSLRASVSSDRRAEALLTACHPAE